MRSKRQIKLEYDTLADLKLVVNSYQEIAATRMRKVKKSVLQNREFMGGLSDLYQRVVVTYKLSHFDAESNKSLLSKSPLLHKKAPVLPARSNNGKTVSVFVSANTGLYGGLVRRIFNTFYQSVSTNSHDLVVIGRMGKVLCETYFPGRTFRYFDAPDSTIDVVRLGEISSYLLNYRNVIVYHGLYVSILEQQPSSTFVTGEALKLRENQDARELKCLIEPSIEEVMHFFEKQISSAIFEQTMYESSLSKFASRMVSLDFAGDNINRSLESLKFAKLKVKHQTADTAQQETLSGLSLWK